MTFALLYKSREVYRGTLLEALREADIRGGIESGRPAKYPRQQRILVDLKDEFRIEAIAP